MDVPGGTDHIEIELALGAAVAGFLVRPDGNPVQGIVRLWNSAGDRVRREVSEDGAFRWDGLAPGECRLTGESDAGAVAARSITLRADESVAEVRLVVEPGGRVSGAVVGLLRGERATVEVRSRSGEIVLTRDFGNGAYSVQGIPDGGTLAARTTFDRHLGRSIRLDELGAAQMDLDFSGDAQLSGIVRANGRPLGGIDLAVVPGDRTRPVAHGTTGELGGYVVQGLSEGDYLIRTLTGHAFDVYVAGHTAFDLDLPAISLSGSVRAGSTDRPVGGGWVRLARIDGTVDSPQVELGTTIASDGRFRFDGLAKGEYIVSIAHRDFVDASQRLHLAGRETVVFHLESTEGMTPP